MRNTLPPLASNDLLYRGVGRGWALYLCSIYEELARPAATQQIVGRERRERDSHHDWSGDA